MVVDEKIENFIQENHRALTTLIKKYDFIEDINVKEIVINIITSTNSEIISMRILKLKLAKYVSNYIKNELLVGNAKSITNILNKVISVEKNNILFKFIEKMGELKLDLDVDDYLNIINYNKNINKLLEEYIDNLTETDDNQKIIPCGIKNPILLDMLEVYCSQNEIQTVFEQDLLYDSLYDEENDYIDNNVKLYLKEIGLIDLLTREEELKYSILSQQGDTFAKKILIESNLRLVVSVARRYTGKSMPFLDLIQEGNIGLMKAVDKYDPSRGNRFSTYAVWCIRHEIIRAIGNKNRNIRIPIYAQEAKSKIENAEISLINELGRYPTLEEISNKSGISIKKIQQIEYLTQDTISLFKVVDDEEELEIGDMVYDIKAERAIEDKLNYNLRNEILSIFDILTQREKETLILRYGLDDNGFKSLMEVGNILGMNYQSAHRHEQHAKEKLKNNLKIKQMQDYINYT